MFNFLSALATAGAGIFGAASAKQAQEETNEKQIAQADKQMQFQREMRATAHQVETQDLLAAGLNPILSAHSGAPMAMGAMAGLTSPGESMRDIGKSVSDATGHAISSAKTASELDVNKSQKRLLDINSAKVAADTKTSLAEASIKEVDAAIGALRLKYYLSHPDVFGLKMEGEGYNLGNIPALLSGSAKGLSQGVNDLKLKLKPRSGGGGW